MKILSNKKYKELLNIIEKKEEIALEILRENMELRTEITYARNLKELLSEIVKKTGIPPVDTKTGSGYLCGVDNGFGISSGTWTATVDLPDTVLQYTDDILGGKVIKQEGNKCIVIDKDGKIKEGLTKSKVDKGYSYKLVRE